MTEHHVSAGIEADKPRAGDALGRTLTRLVGGELVVFGVDDEGRYANRLQGVRVDVRIGDVQVEVVTLGVLRGHAR